MSLSNDDSPDWLHHFQGSTHSTLVLSSDSDSPSSVSLSLLEHENDAEDINQDNAESPHVVGSNLKAPAFPTKIIESPSQTVQKNGEITSTEGNFDDTVLGKVPKDQFYMLSDSDTESPLRMLKRAPLGKLNSYSNLTIGNDRDSVLTKNREAESPVEEPKVEFKLPLHQDPQVKAEDDTDSTVKDATKKHMDSRACASTSNLPLVLPDKVHRSKVLVECEGDSIDLSGDVGAVGRIIISDTPSGNHEMQLDLKGTVYRTSIVPCRTFCVVSFGQTEAKIEAIMNDFVQLKSQSGACETETMIEGTLDGFSFDSEEEADRMPKVPHQTVVNGGTEEQTDGNTSKSIMQGKIKSPKSKQKAPKKLKKTARAPKKARRK